MNTSVLLRLLPATRTGSRLAGVVEIVDTGEVTAFRDAEDLVALLGRIHASAPDPVGAPDRPAGLMPSDPPTRRTIDP